MVTLKSNTGIKFSFDPTAHDYLEIVNAKSGDAIGSLEIDADGMFPNADISQEYQRTGIATMVVRYLVEKCGLKIYFWQPKGQTYDDGRHLSEEGAEWASYLIEKYLASWVNSDSYYDDNEDT